MVTKKDLESVEGRCPYCDGALGEDYSGNTTCWGCRDKWSIETGDSFHEVFGKHIKTWYIDIRKLQSSKESAKI